MLKGGRYTPQMDINRKVGLGNMNGWNMAFTGKLDSTYGIKLEIAGVGFRNIEEGEYFFSRLDERQRDFSFMAGPQASRRLEAFPGTLFGHALFGVKHKRYSVGTHTRGFTPGPGGEIIEVLEIFRDDSRKNNFEAAVGGGVDWGNGRVGIRAPQIDFFPRSDISRYKLRISAGIVFRI